MLQPYYTPDEQIKTTVDAQKESISYTSISQLSPPDGGRRQPGVTYAAPPLDSLTISGTNHTQKDFSAAFKKAVKTRFSGNHWHTRQFREWAEHAENTVICHTCVEAPDADGNQDIGIYALPTNYAFATFAGKRNQGLVYSFAEAITGLPGLAGAPLVHFITLTVPHGLTGSYGDMVQTVEALRVGWSGIRRYLNRWGCRYLRVIEPGGKRGYPHYHLIVLGLTAARAEQLVSRWLDVVPGAVRQAQDVQVVQDINNLGAYLTKTLGYVAKQWDDKRESVHWWHYQELRYRLGIRDIAMDQESRAYIAGKYKNPVSGLACCGETRVKWGQEDHDPDFTEPGDSGILEHLEHLGTVATGNCPKEERVGVYAPRTQAGRVIRPEPRVSCLMVNLVNRHTSKIRKYKIS